MERRKRREGNRGKESAGVGKARLKKKKNPHTPRAEGLNFGG